MSNRVKFFLTSTAMVCLSLGSILYYFYYNAEPLDTTHSIETDQIIQKCTRTTRLKNEPQYDRALSLIEQRVRETSETGEKTADYNYFVHFPSNLTNCIAVVTEEIPRSENAEGYFIFNDERISANYFPITIDSDYRETDDITTALLIVHEMTHVQQHLNELSGKTPLGCLEAEAEAFLAQKIFLHQLSIEEINSINARIIALENPHTQLQILQKIRELNTEYASSACGNLFANYDCQNEVLRVQIKNYLEETGAYSSQCSE